MPRTPPSTVAELEAFVDLLRAACNDPGVNASMEKLLSMPDGKRRGFLHGWITDMMIAGAPQDFVQAIACLTDDAIAEKAYEAIHQCRREGRWPS